jgi:succinate dehydrogenase / fumarate reductase cytochrome b subunit
MLHRVTGLGVLLFLAIHIVDTALVYFAPPIYEEVLGVYQSTLFGVGELALVFCLFFHGVNGVRIAYLDLIKPKGWTKVGEPRSVMIILVITLLLFIPSAAYMIFTNPSLLGR